MMLIMVIFQWMIDLLIDGVKKNTSSINIYCITNWTKPNIKNNYKIKTYNVKKPK